MKGGDPLAARLAALHNAAAREYHDAFVACGARMWHDDNCHPLRAQHQAFIAEQINRLSPDGVRRVYGDLPRPLTVCDGFPSADRVTLDQRVDAIHAVYNTAWHRALDQAIGKLRAG